MSLADGMRVDTTLMLEIETFAPPRAMPSTALALEPAPALEEAIILIPALDEERGIGLVLDQIPFGALQEMGCEVSILVVDGESEDATRENAAEKGAHIFVQSGRGKGNGLRQPVGHILRPQSEQAKYHGQYVIMLDADGTYPVEDIPRLVERLRAGNDVVLGSRLRGRIEPGAMTRLNGLGNRILSLFARVLYGVPVTDVSTGMWGFSERFLRHCDLQARGFELEAEIFASAALLQAQIAEVPIDYRVRQGNPKLVPLRTGAQIAWCLLRKRLEVLWSRMMKLDLRMLLTPGPSHENLPSDT